MTGGRVYEPPNISQSNLPAKRKTTCDDWFSKFVITPVHKYLLGWNVFMTLIYLIAIITDTLIIGF